MPWFVAVCSSLENCSSFEIQVQLQVKLPAYSKLQLQFSYNCQETLQYSTSCSFFKIFGSTALELT
jgi:hypothetical protein